MAPSLIFAQEESSYEGRCAVSGGTIRWQTRTRSNASYYRVYNSTDGRSWRVIGRVEHTQSSEHTFSDSSVKVGAHFRVVQVSGGGEEGTTYLIKVNCGKTKRVEVFPIPLGADGVVNIILHYENNNLVRLSVSDLRGMELLSEYYKVDPGHNHLRFDISALEPGKYILNMHSPAITQSVLIEK